MQRDMVFLKASPNASPEFIDSDETWYYFYFVCAAVGNMDVYSKNKTIIDQDQ